MDTKRKTGKKIKDFKLFHHKKTGIKGNRVKPTNDFIPFIKESNQTIVSRFEDQVDKYPRDTAVKTKYVELSYSELNKSSNQIVRVLCKKFGKGTEGVALLFEHGTGMIAGMLGTLKAGKFYIPLDPTYPVKRLVYMLKDSNTGILLTNNRNEEFACELITASKNKIQSINIDLIDDKRSTENMGIKICPEDFAYILYTSGSTGVPKGVIQKHKNVLHFIRVYTNNLHIHSQDRLTLFSSYSFDASVMDIYGALLNGAALYPFNVKEDGNLYHLSLWLKEEKITIYHSIPTLYRHAADMLTVEEEFPNIRLVVLGGEAVYSQDVERYKKYFPSHCLFINGLGPTESTVTLQYFINKDMGIGGEAVPVGFPVEETSVLLVNEKNEKAPVYGKGEIVFKSDYLAVGYLNSQEKSHEVFTVDPLTGEDRVYRTGDIGRRLLDGSIEFVGRKDDQVKINGYRVEPGEIENAIDSMEVICKSVVTCQQNPNGENFLAAYYVEKIGCKVDENDLKKSIKELLPHYMIPSVYIRLDDFPQTSSGKIDRGALPKVDPFLARIPYVPPRNRDEELLVGIWSEVLKKEVTGQAIL